MYVQLDRTEEDRWAVLVPYPDGGRSFNVPLAALPGGASPGDVFGMTFAVDGDRTRAAREESRALLDGLLKKDETDEKDGRGGG